MRLELQVLRVLQGQLAQQVLQELQVQQVQQAQQVLQELQVQQVLLVLLARLVHQE